MKNNNDLMIVLGVILALFIAGSFGFGMMGFGGMGGMMSGFYGGIGFMWLFGWLFMILTFIALILFIVWLFKQIQK